jgi:peroxiredoxin
MPRHVRTKAAFVLGGAIAAVVVLAAALAIFPPNGESLLRVGAVAPAFTLRSPSGAATSLAALRGKPVLLEFCATWSSPCAVETTALNAVAGTVVSIDGDSENAASVENFVRIRHIRFPMLLDPGSTTVSFPTRGPRGPVTGLYRVTEFPTYYVLDAKGDVVWRAVGNEPAAVLARELRLAARSVP